MNKKTLLFTALINLSSIQLLAQKRNYSELMIKKSNPTYSKTIKI